MMIINEGGGGSSLYSSKKQGVSDCEDSNIFYPPSQHQQVLTSNPATSRRDLPYHMTTGAASNA